MKITTIAVNKWLIYKDFTLYPPNNPNPKMYQNTTYISVTKWPNTNKKKTYCGHIHKFWVFFIHNLQTMTWQ